MGEQQQILLPRRAPRHRQHDQLRNPARPVRALHRRRCSARSILANRRRCRITTGSGFIPAWNVFTQPLAFVLFLICIHAEANRAPFDLAEAEQELVGGYHTEYSSMRFALFFLSEYAGMITTSCVCVALFFGGWHLPWIDWIFPSLSAAMWIRTNPAVTD